MTRIVSFLLGVIALLTIGCDGGGGGGGGGTPDTGPGPRECEYPMASGRLELGETMPPMRWNGVLDVDGVPQDLDLREFHCNAEYDEYRSMILLVSAGWCSACPEYIRMMNGLSDTLAEQGTLLVYLEVETSDFRPADSPDAKEFIDGLIMDGPGLRAGDADNTDPSSVRNLVRQFPSAYFIRRRDMEIVADQAASIYTIDFGALATDPEGMWMPARPPFVANCTGAMEEASEPNDGIVDAAPIAIGAGELTGGICAEPPSDFYRIDEAGAWRFWLRTNFFMYPTGNLDLRLWTLAGERVGGSNQRANQDWVDFEGPAVVEVYGASEHSNVYRVELTPPL